METPNEILVVKVGTSVLTNPENVGELDLASFKRIGQQVLEQQELGRHVAIVSSAAIAAGMAATGTTERPDRFTEIPEAQYLASVGWRHVVSAWADALPGKHVAEMLVTRHDLAEIGPSRELTRVVERTFYHGGIPLLNENDAVSHAEISFGDNDYAAGSFAAHLRRVRLMDAANVKLLLMTDADGFYARPDDPSSVIPVIHEITDEHRKAARGSMSRVGSGGAESKIGAVTTAGLADVDTLIVNGREEDAINRALAGEIGTHFALSK